MTSRASAPDTPADVELRQLLDAEPKRGFVVVAGAGSGKTTSLVKALAHLLSSRGAELESRTQRVACVTYTEVAAAEILGDVGRSDTVHVSTIHSFLWRIVKPFHREIHNWVTVRLEGKIEDAADHMAKSRTRATTRARLEKEIDEHRAVLAALATVDRFTYGIGSNYPRGVLGHSDVLAMVPSLIMEKPLLARLVAAEFPYIFVDESQDTLPAVVECLKRVASISPGTVCLGFFGDPMQQIYQTGVGEVPVEDGWATVNKPQNFRSARRVLAVVNSVRSAADGLTQVPGVDADSLRDGAVYFFVLPADDNRTENLERVREWLTLNDGSGRWDSTDGEGAKILMIMHRMAARRLGFLNLHSAFHLTGSKLATAFDEGSAWPLAPFINVIMPLSDPSIHPSAVVKIIRSHGTILADVDVAASADALRRARNALAELRTVTQAGGPGSVGRALRIAFDAGLIEHDERLEDFFAGELASPGLSMVLEAFMQCDVAEISGYAEYINNRSPYSTQHGTKGSEFPRVLVVLDDDEGAWSMYSYEKLLGLRPLSDQDQSNLAAGADSVLERTRRLLYVCVSRAKEALAIVLFSADVEAASAALRTSGLPGTDDLRTLADLQDLATPR